MSDDPTGPETPTEGDPEVPTDPPTPDEATDPPAREDVPEVDRLRAELARLRKWEKIGKANKGAADRLAEIEEAAKSDLDRATERANRAEHALAQAQLETLRLTVAARHGITGEYLDLVVGDDEEELDAKARKVASLITTTRDETSTVGPYVAPEGTATSGPRSTNADKFAAAVETALSQ